MFAAAFGAPGSDAPAVPESRAAGCGAGPVVELQKGQQHEGTAYGYLFAGKEAH